MESLVCPWNPSFPSSNVFMCSRHSPRLQGSSYKTLSLSLLGYTCSPQEGGMKTEQQKSMKYSQLPVVYNKFSPEYTSWITYILCPETESTSFCSKSQIPDVGLGWTQANGPRECLHLPGFLLPNTHPWHTHLAAIWKTLLPKRRGRKCSIRFYYPLLEEKWPIAWMFPKRMFSCAPCVFQTPIERKNNGWRLGGGWNWVMNLHFKDCDLCWSNYLFTWENKECLFMELPQQVHKLRNAYRFNIV